MQKPESKWKQISVPPIITQDLFDECRLILEEQELKRKPARKPLNTFAGILFCGTCDSKMYKASDSQKYICKGCKKTRIHSSNIEDIYFEKLKSYLLSESESEKKSPGKDPLIKKNEDLLQSIISKSNILKSEMENLKKQKAREKISEKDFQILFKRKNEHYKNLENQIPEIEAEIDFQKIQSLSNETTLTEAQEICNQWPLLPVEEKHLIVEQLTEKITVHQEDVIIKFK